jgi:hypothetical protein
LWEEEKMLVKNVMLNDTLWPSIDYINNYDNKNMQKQIWVIFLLLLIRRKLLSPDAPDIGKVKV